MSDSFDFEVTQTFEEQRTVLAVSGSVRGPAAAELASALDSAIDQHPEWSVVLDLSSLDYMGPVGMIAVANAQTRLAALGTSLSIRSWPVAVDSIFDQIGMGRAVGLPGRGGLGPEGNGGGNDAVLPSLPLTLDSDLHQLTAMPAHLDVVESALRLVVELARCRVNGADGVSISLRRNGVLTTVAATDDTIRAMDADQYETGEGPCVDASEKGRWFHAESLDSETRWPSFTPRARELGIKAILSSPLRSVDRSVGALNIYSLTAETFENKDQESAAAVAEHASVILSAARTGVDDSARARRFQEALRRREAIAIALGVVMERYGLDEDAAFDALLRLSLRRGEPLRDEAEAMVRSAGQPDGDPAWNPDDA
jgi:anti-anti-sigma factor